MNKSNSAFYTLDDGDTYGCIGIIISQLQLEILLAYSFVIIHLVHGFEHVKYEVIEGETLSITFKRNVKGTTRYRRLSLSGSITSAGDDTSS